MTSKLSVPVNRFYFLRHGQTPSNAKGVFQGSLDVPLNDNGQDQARAAAMIFADEPLSGIVASPMTRVRQTLAPTAAHFGFEAGFDEGLKERNFDSLEGTPVPQSMSKDPTERAKEFMEFWYTPPEGVETIDAFYSRVQGAIERHVMEDNTLVVAHGGVLRAVLDLMGKPQFLTQNVFANARPILFERASPDAEWQFWAYSKSKGGFTALD
ncbi:MAG: histidine phosphatase family protein [Alphaproteobacteria bacterium]